MTPAQRRQQMREAARVEILLAARQLVLQGEEFSMRQLAQRVGCSAAALYLHFKNKAELLNELVRQSFAHLFAFAGASVEERPGEDPVERLRRGMRGYVHTGLQHPEEYRLAFLRTLTEDESGRRPHPAFDALRGRVQGCLDAGRFVAPLAAASSAANADLVAQALWAAVHGITSLLILRPQFPWAQRAALIDQVIAGAIDSLVRRSS